MYPGYATMGNVQQSQTWQIYKGTDIETIQVRTLSYVQLFQGWIVFEIVGGQFQKSGRLNLYISSIQKIPQSKLTVILIVFYLNFGKPENNGSLFIKFVWIVTACSDMSDLKDSLGITLSFGSTINSSIKVVSRSPNQ